MKLSPRLRALADLVPPGAVPADIGTDHAFLPVFLVKEGKCPRAIAGDLNPGPYRTALETVAAAGLAEKIDVRLGNGLTILKPGEADTVVIAGMGGGTIREILAASPEVLAGVRRLVLQPMVGGDALRLWLAGQGWLPVDERLVKDEGRIYEVLAVERGAPDAGWDPLTLELGPKLLEKEDPLLVPYLQKILASYQNILTGLAQSQAPEARSREKEIREKIEALKKVMACRLNVRL